MTSHVSVRTPAGVRYSAEVTVDGGRECSTQTYSVLAEHSKPFTRSIVACGASGHAGAPILIQVVKPATRLILDRPAGGCGEVRIAVHGRRQIAVAGSLQHHQAPSPYYSAAACHHPDHQGDSRGDAPLDA